jgi:predicted amidophosphoribosyltransferase
MKPNPAQTYAAKESSNVCCENCGREADGYTRICTKCTSKAETFVPIDRELLSL